MDDKRRSDRAQRRSARRFLLVLAFAGLEFMLSGNTSGSGCALGNMFCPNGAGGGSSGSDSSTDTSTAAPITVSAPLLDGGNLGGTGPLGGGGAPLITAGGPLLNGGNLGGFTQPGLGDPITAGGPLLGGGPLGTIGQAPLITAPDPELSNPNGGINLSPQNPGITLQPSFLTNGNSQPTDASGGDGGGGGGTSSPQGGAPRPENTNGFQPLLGGLQQAASALAPLVSQGLKAAQSSGGSAPAPAPAPAAAPRSLVTTPALDPTQQLRQLSGRQGLILNPGTLPLIP